MGVTAGMSRREKLQYEARIRNLTGTSRLPISMAAHGLIEDEDLIDKLANNSNLSVKEKQVDRMLRKLDNTKPAKWGDGGAYSPEVMYGTDEENAQDWEDSGLIKKAHDNMNEDIYG